MRDVLDVVNGSVEAVQSYTRIYAPIFSSEVQYCIVRHGVRSVAVGIPPLDG